MGRLVIMPITVSNKYSDVVGKAPLATDLEVAQIAVNTADGVLYVKRPNGEVLELYLSKADLDSPALIGIPTAPTPTGTSNSTAIATTAFVQGHVSTLNAAIAALDARLTLIGG
jgi:hypothetical protein